jgi:hypothetical protein
LIIDVGSACVWLKYWAQLSIAVILSSIIFLYLRTKIRIIYDLKKQIKKTVDIAYQKRTAKTYRIWENTYQTLCTMSVLLKTQTCVHV